MPVSNNLSLVAMQSSPHRQLKWKQPPKTILVIHKCYDSSVLPAFCELVQWLLTVKKMNVFVEPSVLEDGSIMNQPLFIGFRDELIKFDADIAGITKTVDFIICLGGDGTLLYASSLFQRNVVPVMAFHLGSLGFLAPFEFNNFREEVSKVIEGKADLTLRSRLSCSILKKCQVDVDSNHLVLNEVVLDRGPSPYLCNLDLYIDGKHITTVQGDGLIVSTPTGSTAYAVAAGASMVHPCVPAIMVTPICPHSLSFRPIVVPAEVELKILVSPDARNSAWVSFDGRDRQELTPGDTLQVTTSDYPMPSICSTDSMSDWFESLGECLHWNQRKRQRQLFVFDKNLH